MSSCPRVKGSNDPGKSAIRFEVLMEGDDAPTTYLVGSIEERHDTFDVLSTSSPLGQALLGRAPGDTISYEGPRRTFAVEVVSVRTAS